MSQGKSTFLALLLTMSAAGVALGGCNTLQGAGEDLDRAGEELEEEVDENTD